MNKQIEELSTKFYFADNMTNDDRWSCNELAEFVISNGYRKSTDAAMEIVQEIKHYLLLNENIAKKCKEENGEQNREYFKGKLAAFLQIRGFIDAELKKKYESEGEG